MTEPAAAGAAEPELRLAPVVAGQVLVGIVRLVAGVAGLIASLVGGADRAPALFAFALGGFGFLVAIGSAERYFMRGEPDPAPAHVPESRLDALRAALFPSTVGVTILLLITIGVNVTAAALLAGVLAGMGAAALLSAAQISARERELDGRLLVDRRSRRVYLARVRDGG